MAAEKDASIETLRGIAILLVVAGYIVRADINPLTTSHDPIGSLLRFSEYALSYIRLPLFTVISGFLYAAAPVRRDTFKKLFRGKMRRILIPFAVFSPLQYAFFSLTSPGYPFQDIFKVFIWPDQQLWFLTSIFFIILIAGALDSLRLLETFRRYAAITLLFVGLHVCLNPTHLFAVYGINELIPYFFLGYGLRRYGLYLLHSKLMPAFLTVFVIAFSIKPLLYQFGEIEMPPTAFKSLGIVVAFSGIPLMFYYRRPVPALAFFGFYAFGIYLFHRVAAQIVRLLTGAWHLNDPLSVFVIYVSGTISAALMIQFAAERHPLTRRWILGEKTNRAKETVSPAPAPVRVLPIERVVARSHDG